MWNDLEAVHGGGALTGASGGSQEGHQWEQRARPKGGGEKVQGRQDRGVDVGLRSSDLIF